MRININKNRQLELDESLLEAPKTNQKDFWLLLKVQAMKVESDLEQSEETLKVGVSNALATVTSQEVVDYHFKKLSGE